MPRIALFTGDASFAVRKGLVELDRRLPGIEWLVVEHSPRKTPAGVMRSQWRNLRVHGWRWIAHQCAALVRGVLDRRAPRGEVDSGAPGSEYAWHGIARRPNVRYLATRDIHSPSTLDRLREFDADLGLSLAAPILREPLFALPRLGTINLHKGKLPDYRGMPPAFWELWNDENSIGCSVHCMTQGLDKGDVIAQCTIPRQRFSTVKGLQLTLDEAAIALTCDAVLRMLSGSARPSPQGPGGQTYRKPTLAQAATLRRKLNDRLPPRASISRRMLKTGYLLGSLYVRAPLVRLFSARPTVTVILYHRISDELRDSLTTGIEQFDRQMALIRRHCEPVSILQVLAGDLPRNPAKPLVCVTFDDGYKDNHAVAVPALLRHGIPAAFFVSTGFIGTAREFPHDAGKVSSPIANMTWDDLRDMKRQGFVIGSHTVNHANCAMEPEDTVRRELRDSLDALRRELGLEDVILAYPFGGREHMTPERLDLVRQTGYSGCLSAYGGFNRGPVDRYNVLRCGVNWAFSDLAFRCRIAGLV